MCGIVGVVGQQAPHETLEVMKRMTHRHRSRGPDGIGFWQSGDANFGHCRLAVIDPTDSSDQPFTRADLQLSIVFNGCIYNYKKLRSELQSFGYRFSSSGDTEVLLCAFDKWGENCVDYLEGMFAFAIFDLHKNSLFLARDRVGIKPLYYVVQQNQLTFSSTLAPLLIALPQVPSTDTVGLNLALNYRCGIPNSKTLLSGINKVEPGTFVKYNGAAATTTRYWNLGDFYSDPLTNVTQQELEERFYLLLKDAIVQRATVTDVSHGLFLSGGIDSTIILAVMRELSSDVKTFSIGFNSWNNEAGDEFSYSDLAASNFSSDHHKIFVEDHDLSSEIEKCICAMSEPMMSEDAIGFYLLSRFAKDHVKVVLCGQGADEILGGYSWYHRITDRGNWPLFYGALRRDRSFAEYQVLVDKAFIDRDAAQAILEAIELKYGALDATAKTMLADTTLTLPEDPLKRVDNMTMAFGLEGRVPFCDHKLIEFCARIPSALKVSDGVGKKILHSVSRGKVPTEILTREKGAFPVPAITQTSPRVQLLINDTLNSAKARQRGVFNYDLIDRWMVDPRKHLTPIQQSKLWQIFVMEKWFQVNGI